MTKEREYFVDFTIPIRMTTTRIHLTKPTESTNYLTYIEVFSPIFWVATCGVLIGISIIVYGFQNYVHFHENSENFGVFNAFAVTFMALFGQPYNVSTNFTSARYFQQKISIIKKLIGNSKTIRHSPRAQLCILVVHMLASLVIFRH
jgi:hypothetical protein